MHDQHDYEAERAFWDEGYPDDDRDDGLPGLPMIGAIVIGLIISAPLWLPLCVAYAAIDQVWNKRRG